MTMATKKKTVGSGKKNTTQKADKLKNLKKSAKKEIVSVAKSLAKKKATGKKTETTSKAPAGRKSSAHSNKTKVTNVKKNTVKKNNEVKKKATKTKVVARRETIERPSPKIKGKSEEKTKKPIHEHKVATHKKVSVDDVAVRPKVNHIPEGSRTVKKEMSSARSSEKPKFIYKPEPSILDSPVEIHEGPRKRYSDSELQEFKDLIQRKLEAAKKELNYLQGLITRKDEAGTDDTENKYMGVEDGSGTMEREQLSQMASRQIQFIDHLEKALVRIENKTYGICRVTGKLIDKARLRAVPHATLSIEAKLSHKK